MENKIPCVVVTMYDTALLRCCNSLCQLAWNALHDVSCMAVWWLSCPCYILVTQQSSARLVSVSFYIIFSLKTNQSYVRISISPLTVKGPFARTRARIYVLMRVIFPELFRTCRGYVVWSSNRNARYVCSRWPAASVSAVSDQHGHTTAPYAGRRFRI
jgi:hypothetical protein